VGLILLHLFPPIIVRHTKLQWCFIRFHVKTRDSPGSRNVCYDRNIRCSTEVRKPSFTIPELSGLLVCIKPDTTICCVFHKHLCNRVRPSVVKIGTLYQQVRKPSFIIPEFSGLLVSIKPDATLRCVFHKHICNRVRPCVVKIGTVPCINRKFWRGLAMLGFFHAFLSIGM
jgi:hypothetical protein